MKTFSKTKSLKVLTILTFLFFVAACTFTQTSSMPPQFKLSTEELTTKLKEIVSFESSKLEGELLTTGENESKELTLTLINGFDLDGDKKQAALIANDVAKLLNESLSAQTTYDRIVIILLDEVPTHEGSNVSNIKELTVTFKTQDL